MGSKKRRRFTEEQRGEVLELIRSSGKPAAQIARELGLSKSSIYSWMKQARVDGIAPTLSEDERVELMKLREENKRLRQERDFLKKCATFFAADAPQNSR